MSFAGIVANAQMMVDDAASETEMLADAQAAAMTAAEACADSVPAPPMRTAGMAEGAAPGVLGRETTPSGRGRCGMEMAAQAAEAANMRRRTDAENSDRDGDDGAR